MRVIAVQLPSILGFGSLPCEVSTVFGYSVGSKLLRPTLFRQAEVVNTQNKNKDAFVMKVYSTYRQELCAYIISKFGVDPSDAEDIVQSAFAKFAELDDVMSIENPRAFLFKACSNIAIDIKRHNKVRHGYSSEVFELEEEATDSVGPERENESRQRLGIIAKAMWAMPSKRRQLLMMSRFDGLSYAEIARQVGLSETVVRKHIAKALEDCRKALKACGE